MDSPCCTNSPSWSKAVCPLDLGGLQRHSDASQIHINRMGGRGSTANSSSVHHPPSPLHGNWMLQTLPGLGSLETCVSYPAITGCTAQAHQELSLDGKKVILVLSNNIL